MSIIYKLCTGNTPEELDLSVQECINLGYQLSGSPTLSGFVDSSGVNRIIYGQSVSKKNE